MREICCFICNRHLGWMTDSGPCGMMFCDECKEADDAKTATQSEEAG